MGEKEKTRLMDDFLRGDTVGDGGDDFEEPAKIAAIVLDDRGLMALRSIYNKLDTCLSVRRWMAWGA